MHSINTVIKDNLHAFSACHYEFNCTLKCYTSDGGIGFEKQYPDWPTTKLMELLQTGKPMSHMHVPSPVAYILADCRIVL